MPSMTRLVLDIPRIQDMRLLLELCERLNITVVERADAPAPQPLNPEHPDIKTILAGLPSRPDWNTWVRDFEESRADRLLPGRETDQ